MGARPGRTELEAAGAGTTIALRLLLLAAIVLVGGIVAADAAFDSVEIREVVTDESGAVSGVLVNRSPRLVREVRLLVRHTFLWKDERNPGDDNPSRATFHVVSSDIPPGGTLPFTYQPLPPRTDGRFVTTVEVVGVTEVGP